jgi:Tfp pilus assembly protein PilF
VTQCRIILLAAALSCLVAEPGDAQEDPHAACAAMGWVPREVLERPVVLRPGVGNAHDVVTTSSPQAQAFYDQGLNYLHGYVWIEAARSFRQALRLDPMLAMAWSGPSRVYSGLDDPEQARRALAEAQTLAASASPREQRLLATAYQHKGQMKQAEATMREAAALAPTTDYVEFNQKLLPVFLLGRGRWDEALEAAHRLANGKWSATRAVGQALSGHALLARGQTPEARAALEAAEHEMATVPTRAEGIGVSRAQVLPWIDTLRGELLLRQGAGIEARRLLEGVAVTLRGLPGPDAWIQALFRLEALARLARDVGVWDLAESLARHMLEHDSAYGGTQLAVALVAEHRGNRSAAAVAYGDAARRWRDADSGLLELSSIRRALSLSAR